MGNHHSQEVVPSAITSHLSNKAKTKLSEQKPILKHFFHHQNQTSKKQTASDQCPTPSTLSASSSSNDYTLINGRKYINTVHSRYFLPCDEDESDRLIVLHFLLKYAFNANFISPVRPLLQGSFPLEGSDDRPKVLDIGTGAGTWILEMASEFRSVDFYGIDIATMYPTTIKPSNAFFQQHDMLDGLPFENESFDFIFMRQMMTSLTKSQLVQLLTEIARVLKPNGYLEIVDVEYQIQRPGPVSATLINQHLREKLKAEGIDFDLCTQLSTLLMTTQTPQGGFVDTRQHRVTMPLGWGGQLGDLHAHNLELFLRSINPNVTREVTKTTKQISDWSPAGMEHSTTQLTEAAIQHTLKECTKYQSHLNWYACTARKQPVPQQQQHGAYMTAAMGTSNSNSSLPFISEKVHLTRHHSTGNLKHHNNDSMPAPPTPPLDPLEWESINSFVTGYVE